LCPPKLKNPTSKLTVGVVLLATWKKQRGEKNMKKNTNAETVATVERERERERELHFSK
jgi:hypothetical protein